MTLNLKVGGSSPPRSTMKYHTIENGYTVKVIFNDGAFTECNWRDMPQEQKDWYVDIARKCGYEDVGLYAYHHDYLHCKLAEDLWDIPSPTLWSVAHNEPVPIINPHEEYMINTLQWCIATQNSDWHNNYFTQVIGADWTKYLSLGSSAGRALG